MKLARGKINPTNFWGVKVRGFAYGKTVLYDPEKDRPILGVIDSGTTLVIIPTVVFENMIHEMAEKFHYDPDIDMVCVRDRKSNTIDHCYFNNTNCETLFEEHGHKLEDFKF